MGESLVMMAEVKKHRAVADLRRLLQEAHRSVEELLRGMPRVTISEFIGASNKPCISGIYAIWEAGGNLAYVGKSENVVLRIRNHTAPSSGGLLDYIRRERGLPDPSATAHRCECGKLIECSHGLVPVGDRRLMLELSKEVKASYTVSVMAVPDGFHFEGSDFETYVQMILKPKYGYEHHPTKGWVPINRRRKA